MATHSNAISALQLFRQLWLGSYKTAWLLCAKLRRPSGSAPSRGGMSAKRTGALREREPSTGVVEVDEAFVSYRTKNDPLGSGKGRSLVGQIAVVAAVEIAEDAGFRPVPARLRLKALPNLTARTLGMFVARTVERGAEVRTDSFAGYQGLAGLGYRHRARTVGIMAANVLFPWVHRAFALLKR